MSKSPNTKALPTMAAVYSQIDTLEAALSKLPDEVAEAQGAGVVELARAMVSLRGLKDRMEEALKPFETLYAKVKDIDLPQAFDTAGVPSVSIDEGFRVGVAHTIRAAVKGGMKEQAIAWLRENDLADIVSETINASTLSAVARTLGEENRELSVDFFNVHVMPTTSVTKTTKG